MSAVCAHPVWLAGILSLLLLTSGCRPFESIWNRSLFWGNNPPPVYEDPTPYRNWATEIDYPDVTALPGEPELSVAEPRRLRNHQKEEIWDMPLEQAIQIALSNSHVIRSAGQFLSPADPLLNSPDFVPSSLDPAIQESGVLFGQRGVEAALSEFDTQLTTTMIWGRDEQVQNSQIGTGVTPGSTLTQETGAFSMGLTKRFATGGIVAFINDINYQGTNTNDFIPGARLFPSAYTGRVRVEARQPLWAGAGTEYTRIAGPITEQIQGVTGVQQGVVIARINNDIELTEFAGSISDLLRDVETLYWQLYLAYQAYDMEKSLLAEAEASYGTIDALLESDSPYAGTLEMAESATFVLQMQNRVDSARSNLYDMEAQLRRIIGLTINDGKVIRPLDEPTLAEFVPDWHLTLSEALARRVELRKQKWNIKKLELQLRAAEKLVKPRLDVVGSYQVNGFGDDLLGDIRTNNGTSQTNLGNEVATIVRGDQTGWNLGVEFSFPFGMRFAHTQVSNLAFQVAKARATLEEQESEIRHQLGAAFRDLDETYLAMQNRYNLKLKAVEQVEAIEALHQDNPDRWTESAVLQRRDNLAQMEQGYMQAMIDYNVAVMELHYRAGKLLEMNNIHLSEGPWDAEAEYDVLDRGYDRWHSLPTKTMMHAAPEPFVFPGETVTNVPPTEFPMPPQENGNVEPIWPGDDSPIQEPFEPPAWDLKLPELPSHPQPTPTPQPTPAPAEPTQRTAAPQYLVPPALLREPESESPINGPQEPTTDGGQFLLPAPSTRPEALSTPSERTASPIRPASHAQPTSPVLRKPVAAPRPLASTAPQPQRNAAPAASTWDLGSGAGAHRTRSRTGKPATPRSQVRPRNAEELRARIQRASAQARGYAGSVQNR